MITFEFEGRRPLRSQITSSRLNEILQELRRVRPTAGRGINIDYTGGGARVSLIDEQTGAGGGAIDPPRAWDVYVSDTTGEGNSKTYKLKVRPGTIAGILPNNWDAEFTADNSSLYYARANVSTDGFAIISAEIVIDSTVPSLQQPLPYAVPATGSFIFGIFKEGRAFRIASGALSFAPRTYMVTEKTGSVGPGESPYNIYYQLAP